MSVDLRNYVLVNINYHKVQPLNRTRDTVILFTTLSGANDPKDKLNTHIVNGVEVDYFTSLADYEAAIVAANEGVQPANQIVDNPSTPKLYNFVRNFFNNGGVKLKIIGGFVEPSTESDPTIVAQMITKLKELDSKYIVITADCDEATLREVALSNDTTNVIGNGIISSESVATFTGYKEKIFISSVEKDDALVLDIDNPDKLPNYVIKVGFKGVEMGTAAYLSRMNVEDQRTINTYCYTIEDTTMYEGETDTDDNPILSNSSLINNNDEFVELSKKQFNIVTTLINNNRNVMGNTIAGIDLMNYYMRIVLTQTLSDRIINVLATKVKFDRTGVNKVANAITQELNLYRSNGYLNTDFIWTDDDLYYSFNGEDYLVCARNTPLVSGYKFTILPITSLTPEQKARHTFPPVYVLLADSLPVKQMVILGDIY